VDGPERSQVVLVGATQLTPSAFELRDEVLRDLPGRKRAPTQHRQSAKRELVLDAGCRDRRLQARLKRPVVCLLEKSIREMPLPLTIIPEQDAESGVERVVGRRRAEVRIYHGINPLRGGMLVKDRAASGLDQGVEPLFVRIVGELVERCHGTEVM